MFDKFREECALIGVWNHTEAANLAYLGLYAQQHRGQEGAGVVSLDRPGKAKTKPAVVAGPRYASHSGKFHIHRGLGLVADVFSDFDFTELPGDVAIGHVRYTTAGGNLLANVQPLFSELGRGCVAIGHNGNLINTDELRQKLVEDGAIFGCSSDTELFLHLIAKVPSNIPTIEAVISAVQQVKGAYSLVMLFEDRMLAVRDPNGLRPLVLGELNGSYMVASETCAFDLVGATYIREVEAGEIVEISGAKDLKSYFPFGSTKATPCIFEYVYFARPDSTVFGQNVYQVRKRLGEELAREHPVPNADMVIPVPDSGTPAALGFAHAAKIPLEFGLIRNHYVGRTFIEPKQSIRDFGVKLKLNANPELLQGKIIVVVDDSLVRGTTSKKLVAMLKSAGAKEVHFRVSSPPTTDPCYYGIDTPQKAELIASNKSVEEIAKYIGVDSLAYLSFEGLHRATNTQSGGMCDACFSGKYPVGTPGRYSKRQTELWGKS